MDIQLGSKWITLLFAILVAGLSSVRSDAALLLATVEGGETITVLPGELFSVAIVFDAPVGVQHNSSLFGLIFTQTGLIYEGYTWAAPYENQTIFDFSSPQWSALPLPIEPGLNPGPASSLVMSNVVPAGTFGSGVLVTLDLRVPSDWTEVTTIAIVPVPDTFANGFDVVPVSSGGGVFVSVVPGPGAAASLMLAGAFGTMRRRRS